jgi:hypothetical protein
MTLTLDHGGIVVGIDPAAKTGLVVVRVPSDLALERCALLASGRITFDTSKFLTPPQRDYTLQCRVNDWIYAHALGGHPKLVLPGLGDVPEWHVAIEEPVSISTRWISKRRGTPDIEGTGTAFRLGVAYGLVLSGVTPLLPTRIDAYPPTPYHGRTGWMGGGRRDRVLATCQLLWRDMAARGGCDTEPNEDTLMALGVVTYHLNVLTGERRDRKVNPLASNVLPR